MPTLIPDSLIERMGIVILEMTADTVVGTMPVDGNRQIHGLLHGGASAALAETLGSLGAYVHAGEGQVAVGVDLNITHHRAVRHGIVTGTATQLAPGTNRRRLRHRDQGRYRTNWSLPRASLAPFRTAS